MADLENLNLSDDEEVINFRKQLGNQERKANTDLCLVGRLLTYKILRVHMMKERMTIVWDPGRGVAIKEIEKGVFLFQFFFHKLDMQKVINGEPWNFDGHLLILNKVGAGDVPTQVPLFHVMFWIQVHDLHVGFMNNDMGKGLSNLHWRIC